MGVAMHALEDVDCGRCKPAATRTGRARLGGALALALALVVGCASDHTVPASPAGLSEGDDGLRSTPCAVVSRDMVSAAFAVDAALIEQSSMSSLCVYRRENGSDLLDVTVHVSAVAGDADEARALFEQATAADLQSSPAGSAGPFEEVPDVGDQARFDVGNSDLHIRSDRLYFTLNAYSGPKMEAAIVDTEAAGRIDAHAQWWQATLPQRRLAARTLGNAWMAAQKDR
ncbi:hypothetical protein [Novilysobacter antarcticus]|uniref:hypothetical protein n=1 Tax=Novilysobacter antarcticus TaxID=2862543 RepID=UPI001C99BE3F|nr:hypothetical protein [Lysobacter antarcticus]